MSTDPKLTAEIEDRILVWIRNGAFPHLAAEAEGVPQEVFESWLARGSQKRASRRYRDFARNVRKAIAVGRIRAEIRVLEKDPKLWLLSGPGKERSDCPGWTATVKSVPRRDAGPANLFADPAGVALVAALLAALAPFPDARRAAAQALDGLARG
jgi:hypothetical protein